MGAVGLSGGCIMLFATFLFRKLLCGVAFG